MPPATAADLGYTPPDGGWGWAVVFGSFLSIGFSYAFPKSLTIYFTEIQKYFSISYSEIAWVSSIMLATMYAGGNFIYLEAWHSSPIYYIDNICKHKCPILNFAVSFIHAEIYFTSGGQGKMEIFIYLWKYEPKKKRAAPLISCAR